jgi:hypothetical protein
MNKKFAVFVKRKIDIPGDERSRTNPGHGYPAETRKFTEVLEFDDAAKLREWVERNHGIEDFRVVKFNEIEVRKVAYVEFENINGVVE